MTDFYRTKRFNVDPSTFGGVIDIEDFNTNSPNKKRISNQIDAMNLKTTIEKQNMKKDKEKEYKNMTLEELRELRLISNTDGRPTSYMTDEKWQKEFNLRKLFITPYPNNIKKLKGQALHDERLDDIITWGIELSLKHINNFHVLKRNLDTGIADMDIRGKTYIAVHGDFDGYNKTGVSNLCMHLGFIPYAITYGHLHTCAIDETNGVKMIRGGSLAGSGDSYTIEKRLSGKPSQMVCICNKKGVICYYPIELD